MQETLRHGLMMPWIALAYRHGEKELEFTATVLDKALPVLRTALNEGIDKYLIGDAVKPVFRKFN